jgi:hypothetical protein
MRSIRVLATFSSDEKGDAAMDLLESQLPILAGCLAGQVNVLDLSFEGNAFPTITLLNI